MKFPIHSRNKYHELRIAMALKFYIRDKNITSSFRMKKNFHFVFPGSTSKGCSIYVTLQSLENISILMQALPFHNSKENILVKARFLINSYIWYLGQRKTTNPGWIQIWVSDESIFWIEWIDKRRYASRGSKNWQYLKEKDGKFTDWGEKVYFITQPMLARDTS